MNMPASSVNPSPFTPQPVNFPPALQDFAGLLGAPLLSPISFTRPGPHQITPSAMGNPNPPGALTAGDAADPEFNPEFNFFPDANSLGTFLPQDLPEAVGLPDGSGVSVFNQGQPVSTASNARAPAAAAEPSAETSGGGEEAPEEEGPNRDLEIAIGVFAGAGGDPRSRGRVFRGLQDQGFDEDTVITAYQVTGPGPMSQHYAGTPYDQIGAIDRGGGAKHKGGLVTGSDGDMDSGQETSSTKLLEGEFVMTRQAVEMFGVDFFEGLNEQAAKSMGEDKATGSAPPEPNRKTARPASPVEDFANMI